MPQGTASVGPGERLGPVLRPYRDVLTKPGTLSFSTAGLVARLPISMVGIGIVLMVSAVYGSYGLARRGPAIALAIT